MIQNDIFLSQKVASKFHCEKCDYKCNRKNNFEKHCDTKKHKMIQNDIFLTQKVADKLPEHFSCICGAFYKHRSSLSRHRKMCSIVNKNSNVNEIESVKLLITTIKEIILEKNSKINELTSILNANMNTNPLNY